MILPPLVRFRRNVGQTVHWQTSHYFAMCYSSRCFSYIKRWVEEKVRQHMIRRAKALVRTRWSSQGLSKNTRGFYDYRVVHRATLSKRIAVLPGTWRTEFAPHPGWRIPTMTFVAPPTTSRSSVAKAWSANSRTPTDTLFLSKPSVPSQRSSSYEKNCSVPSSLPFTNPETATNPKTVLQSTNTTRTCAKTCSPSCRTSGSQPSNRQDFVDLDSPSA